MERLHKGTFMLTQRDFERDKALFNRRESRREGSAVGFIVILCLLFACALACAWGV